MYYKGMDVDPSKINKPYTLNDIPESTLSKYTDVVPRYLDDTPLTYRQRIVEALNRTRSRIASNIATRIHNLDKLELLATNYNANPGQNIFQPRKAQTPDEVYLRPQVSGIRYSGPREFTTLDIETDDYGHPITISALKQVFNRETGQFETIGNFQRFYQARNRDLAESSKVHGLSSQKLNRLRGQQGKFGDRYGKTYNDREAEALKSFLGGSVIVGHNIVDFDLPHLFKTPLNNQTIDTLTAARNQWAGRKNDLDSVFKRLYGKTMDEAGLPHHDSMSDVIATAMVMQKMAVMQGETGNALRYVMQTAGTHMAPRESYLNSQVIRGVYNEYQNIERYLNMSDYDKATIEELMGASQKFGKEYNEATGRYEVPEGFHTTSGIPDYDIMSDISSFTEAMLAVGKDIKEASKINGAWAQSMSSVMSAHNFSEMRRFRLEAARYDVEDREAFIRAAGYGESEVLNIMKGTNELHEIFDRRKASKLKEQLRVSEWEAWREGDPRLARKIGGALSRDTLMSPEDVWNYQKDVAAYNKLSKRVFAKDRDKLFEAIGTPEFASMADEVSDKMNKITGSFKAFASIPVYNFERLEAAFKGEVGGIKGAARGIVPSVIYNPLSRLTDAGMNALTGHYADLKYGARAGTAIGGGLMGIGGALMGTGVGVVPGLITMGIGGALGAGSQIFGNYKEAQITKWGEGIQNNLNTLGFLQEMILMPFRLLKMAIDKVIKGFSMLTSVLRGVSNVMVSGLSGLTQMGNPLTGMTGVNYGAYMGSTSADYASLLGKGTINNIFNDFATQRMKLYTTGQIDTNRLVAASMLGIFNQTYGSTMNEEDAFTDAMNQLREVTKNQTDMERKQTYVLANMVNPNMAAILQTMDTLGINNFADLKHPSGVWGYSEDAISGYRSRFQRAQWEYQYAGMQRDLSVQRIGSRLWEGGAGTFGISGRGLYNDFNKFLKSVADAMDTGNWTSVGRTIKSVWETIKTGAEGVWTTIKEIFGIDAKTSFGGAITKGFADIGVKALELLRDKIIPPFLSIWDRIASYAIDKLTGIIEFLSTIRVDFNALKQMVLTGKSNKPWITSIMDTKLGVGAYEAGESEALDKMYTLSREYDIAHNKYALIQDYGREKGHTGGRMVQGIAGRWGYTGGQRGDVLTTSKDDFTKWLSATLQNASPSELDDLNARLSAAYGRPISLTKGDSAEQFLNDMLRMEINPNATNFLTGNRYALPGDISSSTIHNVMGSIMSGSNKYRDVIIPGLIDQAIDALTGVSTISPQEPAVLKIQVKDDKGSTIADAEVNKEGKVNVSRYNGFVDITAKDGVYQFAVNQSSRVSGY